LDGSCGSTKKCNPANVGTCSSGHRCEDGFCRNSCLQYDGCGINPMAEKVACSYHCANRTCAETPAGCPENCEQIPERRRLAQTTVSSYCVNNCVATIKTTLIDMTIHSQTTSTVVIAQDKTGAAISWLTIPSGAVATRSGTFSTTLSLRPVGENRMRPAVNPIHRSRRNDPIYHYPDILNFAESVISPAFECLVPPDVIQPFGNNFSFRSVVDSNRYQAALPATKQLTWIEDTCLAQLVVIGGISFWSCVFSENENRRLVCQPGYKLCHVGQFTDWKPTDTPPLNGIWVASSVMNTCVQTQGVSSSGAVAQGVAYAFITNPLLVYVPPAPAPPNQLQQNVIVIVVVFLAIIACICAGFYVAVRMSRYRAKYKKEKKEADRLHEELENMEHFGAEAGNKDDAVVMSENPLAQKLTSLQAAVDETTLKLQAKETELKKEEAAVRSEHLANMQQSKQKMTEELEKLKAQLAATQLQQRGGATQVEDYPTNTGDYGDSGYGDDGQDGFGAQAPAKKAPSTR